MGRVGRDYTMTVNRDTKCTAETLTILGETVIVDRRFDICKAQLKQQALPWQAVLCGTTCVVDGDSKEDVVEAITRKIESRQNLHAIQLKISQMRFARY